MANVMFGFPNRLDEATLSGGAWEPGIDQLLDRRLTRVSRSVDLDPASSQFVIEFAQNRELSAIALCGHNITTRGKWRITIAVDSDFEQIRYQTPWLNVWQRMYTPNMLRWESPNFWDGMMLEEQRKGYPALALHTFPLKLGKYIKIEVLDPSNQSGYVEIGRAFAGATWSPVINASYGASVGWSTDTTVDKAIGGTEYPDVKKPRRVVSLVLGFLSPEEAMGQAFEMDRMAGIDKDVLFVFNQDDKINLIRNSFIGRFQALDPISYPYNQFRSKAYKLIETV